MSNRDGGSKYPPLFDEDITFSEWMKLLEFWSFSAVGIEETKHGALVYLHSFKNNLRARKAVESLDKDKIKAAGGLKLITDRLKSIYIGEENDSLFKVYRDYHRCVRNETHKTMSDYIVDFETKYSKMAEIVLKLSTVVGYIFEYQHSQITKIGHKWSDILLKVLLKDLS